MGKLNIAHHKSYHPYRLDNIERVRLDEAAAKRKQTEDIDRALAAVRPPFTHRPRTTSNLI
jgi:N-terminal domain of CBF1 interacting co-repressor CIR